MPNSLPSTPFPVIVTRTPNPALPEFQARFIVMYTTGDGHLNASFEAQADMASALAYCEQQNARFRTLKHQVFALVPVELTAPGPVLVEKPRTCICGFPIRRTDEVEIGAGAERVWIHLSGDFSCATPGQYATPAEEGEV